MVRWTCGWKSQNDCKKKIVKGQKSGIYWERRVRSVVFKGLGWMRVEDDKVGKRQV